MVKYLGGMPIKPKYAIPAGVGLTGLALALYLVGCPRKPQKPAEQKKSYYSMDTRQQQAQQRQAEDNVCIAFPERNFAVKGGMITLHGLGKYNEKPCSYEMTLGEFCDLYDLCKKKPTTIRRPVKKAIMPKTVTQKPPEPHKEEVVETRPPEVTVEPPARKSYPVLEQPAPPSYLPKPTKIPVRLRDLRNGTYRFSDERCPPYQPFRVNPRGNR